MKRRRIRLSGLKVGDRFSFVPPAWHGSGVVIESRLSGESWCVRFDNAKVINPPGVFYGKPETIVMLLKDRR